MDFIHTSIEYSQLGILSVAVAKHGGGIVEGDSVLCTVEVGVWKPDFFSSFYDFISIFRLFYMCKIVFTAFAAILCKQKNDFKFIFLCHFV